MTMKSLLFTGLVAAQLFVSESILVNAWKIGMQQELRSEYNTSSSSQFLSTHEDRATSFNSSNHKRNAMIAIIASLAGVGAIVGVVFAIVGCESCCGKESCCGSKKSETSNIFQRTAHWLSSNAPVTSKSGTKHRKQIIHPNGTKSYYDVVPTSDSPDTPLPDKSGKQRKVIVNHPTLGRQKLTVSSHPKFGRTVFYESCSTSNEDESASLGHNVPAPGQPAASAPAQTLTSSAPVATTERPALGHNSTATVNTPGADSTTAVAANVAVSEAPSAIPEQAVASFGSV